MNARKIKAKPALGKSLRLRIISIVIFLTVIIFSGASFFIIQQFRDLVEYHSLHEGLLLSDTLAAALAEPAARSDIAYMQTYIDRLVDLRDKNDVEVNIMFLEGEGSTIVASNDPLNLEETDEEEHEDLIEALRYGKPVVFIERDSYDIDPDDDPTLAENPEHTDYYLRPGQRFISITTPLKTKTRDIGSINVILSLSALDEKTFTVYATTAVVLIIILGAMSFGIYWLLNHWVFNPIWSIAERMYLFGLRRLQDEMKNGTAPREDEIGIVAREFNHMVDRIQKAEAEIQENLAEIARQKEKNEEMLLNILPAKIVDRIKDGEHMIADAHANITVLFADLVGFTAYAARNKPEEVVTALNEVFRRFDALAMDCGVEKIKTIGDAYMAVAGLPEPIDDHVERAARMALGMRTALADVNKKKGLDFRLRIGLHTGPAVAGVIGTHKFAYDVWGDTVNTASRFESAGESGRIHISEAVADYLSKRFSVTGRGPVEIRDLGRVKAFFLEDAPQQTS